MDLINFIKLLNLHFFKTKDFRTPLQCIILMMERLKENNISRDD